MLNKNILKWLLLILVVLSLIFVLFRNRSPFGRSNTSFASNPENEITRIEFTQGDDKLTLEKREDKWLLNGRIETRKSSINFIIRVLQELNIKSPVSPELFGSEILEKGIVPVKVKTWEKRKLLSSFLVYKTQSNIYGNIMKTSNGAKPFIVYVPGHEVNIGSAFILNELYWQPYTIFNLLPSEIALIDFESLSDSANSFSITRTKRRFELTDGTKNLSNGDSTLISRYISYFTYIPFESWALDVADAEKDSIISGQPVYRISVTMVTGEKTVLTLWERTTEKGEKDSDRMYGKTDSSDGIFVVRYFDIDPLLKKRSYFFGK